MSLINPLRLEAEQVKAGKKSYFCTSHSHVFNILCLLELSQDSPYDPKSKKACNKKQIYKKVKRQHGSSLKSHYYDGIHTNGADMAALVVILEKYCSELY